MRAAITPSTIRNMDWPGARAIADQAEKTLPPELRTNRPEGQMPSPEEMMERLQQAQGKEEEMMQVIQGLQKAVQDEQVKAEAEMAKQQQADQVKMQIEQAKVQASERESAMALLMKQAQQESADSVKAKQLDVEMQKLRAEIDMHTQDIASAEKIATMNAQVKLETSVQTVPPGRRKTIVTNTVNRDENGEAVGTDETRQEVDEPLG
jgi:seryl-tRNA synthetase